MKIGIMLRALGEKQGIGIYSRNLVDHILALDTHNEYYLYYRKPEFLGRYEYRKNVTERWVPGRSKFFWDQVQVPLQAFRDRLDVLFHTKFSVPLLCRAKTVMALHGAGWFVHPELFRWRSVLYQRLLMPLYCWKAAGLIANSELTKADYVRFLRVDPRKIRTVHLAADDRFRPIRDDARLHAARAKYRLPERFILSVIKRDPRKNFANLIEAFRLCRERTPCKLVVVGMGCEKYREEYRIRGSFLDDDIVFLEWVEQDDLVSLYNLAEFLFFPSWYETFGIPVCEAIACGRPVVIANTGALPEIAGAAGVAVEPSSPPEMAEALYGLWTDDGLRGGFAERSRTRSRDFSWANSARETIEALEAVVYGDVQLIKGLSASIVRSSVNRIGSGSSE